MADMKKIILSRKINKRAGEVFQNILNDLPKNEDETRIIARDKYIVGTNCYSGFWNSLCNYASDLNTVIVGSNKQKPSEYSSAGLRLLDNLITNVPNSYKNIVSINSYREIIKKQNEILNTYFIVPENKENIKNKIYELKDELQELIDDGDIDLVDKALDNFEGRMRKGLLNDLTELSKKIKEVK